MRGEREGAGVALLASTTRVMVCCGEGCAVHDVRRAGRIWSARDVAWVEDLRDARAVDQARAAISRAGAAQSVVLVVGARDVHLRPMALSSRLFVSAREEIERNLESLMPIEPSRARLGFIDRAPAAGKSEAGGADQEPSGYLIGMESEVAMRLQGACEGLLGRAPNRTVAPHQAVLCAGFQESERAVIREHGSFGDLQDTVFENGLIAELRRDADESIEADLVLPTGTDPEDRVGAERLAIGAAALDAYGSSLAAPLDGRWSARWKRAAPAAVLALACAGLLIVAASLRERRYADALASIVAEQERIRAQVVAAERAWAERDRLGLWLTTAAESALVRDASAMEVMAVVELALPEDSFLEMLRVEGRAVQLRGVASSARDVLAAIEASDHLIGAREAARPQPVGDGSGREVFDVRAEFRSTAGGEP